MIAAMRWLYHLTARGTDPGARYAPASLAGEGFVHCSPAPAVAATAGLYFPPEADLVAWRIDPRRLDVPVVWAETPRGPMPHVHGSIPRDALRAAHGRGSWGDLPDRVVGHRVAFVAFEGMTLLDLVGVHDPVSRLRTMGFDPAVVTHIVGACDGQVWRADGAALAVDAVRPSLAGYDLVVIPGGPGAQALADDPAVTAWLAERSPNRAWASVCTGALVLAAAGLLRGRRAATHRSARGLLAARGDVTAADERVVRDGPVFTAAGVTAALDLGLSLVSWLADDAVRDAIAAQMEWPAR
jgi:putative intracellular protease/amidase/uncharacterized protein (DUF952 family)